MQLSQTQAFRILYDQLARNVHPTDDGCRDQQVNVALFETRHDFLFPQSSYARVLTRLSDSKLAPQRLSKLL